MFIWLKKTIIDSSIATPSNQNIYIHSSFPENAQLFLEFDKGHFIMYASREIPVAPAGAKDKDIT